MNPTIRHHYSGHMTEGQIYTQSSQAIPDQAMTIKEIYARYASGYPVGAFKTAQYTTDEMIDSPYATVDFKNMDLADREAYIKQMKQEKQEARERYDNAVKAQNERRKQAHLKKWIAQQKAGDVSQHVQKQNQDIKDE